MKQCFKYALRYATVVVMMLSALTFTACGGDDDEGDGNQSGQVDMPTYCRLPTATTKLFDARSSRL